jgi:hypothetical protein
MKKMYLVLPFMVVSFYFLSAQNDCDLKNLPNENTYSVRIIEGSVESSDVRPRKLTDEEKCLVESSRLADKSVIIQLDMYTEVEVFPLNKSK